MPARLRWLLAVILLGSLAVGLLADKFVRSRQSPKEQAEWLLRAGKPGDAETIYFRELEKGPITVPLLIAFLDAHALGSAPPLPKKDSELEPFVPTQAESIREHAIDALLAREDLPPDVALLGRFWRDLHQNGPSSTPHHEVEVAADAEPPMPWANHLLARDAARADRLEDAALRYEREGVSFGRSEDVDAALALREATGDWMAIGERLKDPRVDRLASPWAHFRYAVEARNWPLAFRWSWKATYHARFAFGPVILALLSALCWFTFCARLGRVGEAARIRVPLYLSAFALGLVSVYPTDILIAVEESVLHLEHTGETLHDILYFTFGVGFREELSKLLLFAPLVPVLLRGVKNEWASKLDVLVCGALVGLGFAAVENLLYLEHGDLGTAMARFLTANFLHMSMTALVATAFFEAVREPEKYSFDFSRTVLTVMVMHGAYDYFIVSPDGLSYFAMGVFVLLARQFMVAVHEVRGRVGRGLPLLHVFVLGMALVVGSSFVYAASRVGPGAAAAVLMEGMLGLFIVLYFFVQELRRV